MFGTHGLGLVPCFGQEPAWLTLWWLTMVMDILKLQATVGSVAQQFLAVYTWDKKPCPCMDITIRWFLILGVYGKKWWSYVTGITPKTHNCHYHGYPGQS